LIGSGYGEQKTVALYLLDRFVDRFTPDRFDQVDQLFRQLHGWSKIDAYTGSFLKTLLTTYPEQTLQLVSAWNRDVDPWLRRASVVLFTRKTAASGLYTDAALEFCEHLKHDPEDMVRKGVGWCLKDLMKADRQRVIDYVIELRRQKVSSTITLYALRDIKGEERKTILESG
jgi:3-methyladenine DNA glycosylase AlkD